MEFLPDEVLNKIFLFLDFQQVHEHLVDVCTRWNDVIRTNITAYSMIIRTYRDIQFVKSMRLVHSIKHIEIQYKFTTVTQIFDELLPLFPHLEGFALHKYNKLDDADVERLHGRYPNLQYVNIFLKGEKIGNNFFEKFKKINSLVLNNKLTNDTFPMIQKMYKRVEEFHLYGHIDIFPSDDFICLFVDKCLHLKKLTLRCSTTTNDLFETLYLYHNLTHLRLYHSKMVTDMALAKLTKLPPLTLFHLTGLKSASKYGLDTVLLNMDMSNLVDLNLSGTAFDDYSAQIVVDSAVCLERLELWQCENLTSVGIFALTTGVETLETFDTDIEVNYKEVFCIVVMSDLKYLRIGVKPEDIPIPEYIAKIIRVKLNFDNNDVRGNNEGYSANLLQYNTMPDVDGFIKCRPVREQKLPFIEYYRNIAPRFSDELAKMMSYSVFQFNKIPHALL